MHHHDDGKKLDQLRSEIERIDKNILELIARRLSVVLEIGTIKGAMNLPVRAFHVEREVSRRMREWCRELDIDPGLGRLLARLLIEASVRKQGEIIDRSFEGVLRNILVLGGSGRMGVWISRYLRAMGHRVSVYDPAGPADGFGYEPDLEPAVRRAEMIVLSTPLRKSGGILEQVIELEPPGIIFDICSLKSPLLPAVRRGVGEGLRITSLHPMFGPGVKSLLERNVILCRCGCPGADREVRALFEGTGARLIGMEIEEHDEYMACVLGMSHAVNLMFAGMLERSGKSLPDLEKVASSTFTKQLKTMRDVSFEAEELYYDIQTLNENTERALENFTDAVEEFRAAVLSRDSNGFRAIMKDARNYFGGRNDNGRNRNRP